MAMGMDGGSNCEDSKSELETQEEYLAKHEAALGTQEVTVIVSRDAWIFLKLPIMYKRKL
jgi:hypothetical protein